MFDALVFTIFACGFRPRSAREMEDAGQTRIEKLYEIIEGCRYGIHDLSRTDLDPEHGLPRFNMPLELGIFLGAKRFGGDSHRQKRCLVLDIDRRRYQKFISDLAGVDIHGHDADIHLAVETTRNWLATASRRKITGPQRILEAYDRFTADKPAIADTLGFNPSRIPYVDLEGMITNWLVAVRP
ncbi:MAG: hypothetical protein JWP35_3367 [Caulobacter sp.]|nr:hypothetical protein [Caulobacter sp.]